MKNQEHGVTRKLLFKIEQNDTTPYHALLENKELLKDLTNVENISVLIYRLLAQGFIQMESETDGESGEEYFPITLTDFGKAFIESLPPQE